jgi:hypothetical protein
MITSLSVATNLFVHLYKTVCGRKAVIQWWVGKDFSNKAFVFFQHFLRGTQNNHGYLSKEIVQLKIIPTLYLQSAYLEH